MQYANGAEVKKNDLVIGTDTNGDVFTGKIKAIEAGDNGKIISIQVRQIGNVTVANASECLPLAAFAGLKSKKTKEAAE